MFDNNAKIDLTCPSCDNHWREPLGRLRKSSVRCPACRLELDTTPFRKSMAASERMLKGFGR